MIEYTINGSAVTEEHAYTEFVTGYLLAGYTCKEELHSIWNARGTSEEARDTIFGLSNYTLEIFTEEEL